MACKKCGGGHSKKVAIQFSEYEISGIGERAVVVGVSSAILLKGLPEGELFLRSGKVIKLSEADTTQLILQKAPIWKIS